jgi:peroxiredoxin Q/BCP
MFHRNVMVAAAALAISHSFARAQTPAQAQPEQGPKVGDLAPDFTLGGATKDGVIKTPVTLSKFRGQTVIVAFFPKARTRGCTAQMTTYRDQWATLFNGGKGVQVIAISMDADTTQANWAKEASLPMIFASDMSGEAGKKYGSFTEGQTTENRLLYVVGPDGKIAYTAKPFRALSDTSYVELGAAVKKTAGFK